MLPDTNFHAKQACFVVEATSMKFLSPYLDSCYRGIDIISHIRSGVFSRFFAMVIKSRCVKIFIDLLHLLGLLSSPFLDNLRRMQAILPLQGLPSWILSRKISDVHQLCKVFSPLALSVFYFDRRENCWR